MKNLPYICFAGVTKEEVLRCGYQSWLEKLKSFIEGSCEEAREIEIKFAPYSRRPLSVTFTFPYNDEERGTVDLLVSPYWGGAGDQEPQVFYQFLTTHVPRKKRAMYVNPGNIIYIDILATIHV